MDVITLDSFGLCLPLLLLFVGSLSADLDLHFRTNFTIN